MKSWFYDPVGNGLKKSRRNDGCSRMVLHGHHRRFRVERAVRIPQSQNLSELQRSGAGKQYLPARPEFDYRALLHSGSSRLAASAGELNRNANRRSFREKAGQVGYRAGLTCPRLSCGLLRQAMTPKTSTISTTQIVSSQFNVRLGSPSSRLGRSLGSQNTRLCGRRSTTKTTVRNGRIRTQEPHLSTS